MIIVVPFRFCLLKYKSEVGQCLITFCNMIKTQFETKVKHIRSDNGPEFQSCLMMNCYAENGIVLETSCTDTPQKNGVVERKHRHILEIARALRFDANFPIQFWGECILTTTYLINHLPSRAVNNKTPFEIVLGKKPSYEHLHVFGWLVYAGDYKKGGDKFGEQGRPCAFVGYPNGQKGYRVYDLQDKKIYTSQDVQFFECKFPFPNTRMCVVDKHNPLDQHIEEVEKHMDPVVSTND